MLTYMHAHTYVRVFVGRLDFQPRSYVRIQFTCKLGSARQSYVNATRYQDVEHEHNLLSVKTLVYNTAITTATRLLETLRGLRSYVRTYVVQ